MYMTSALLWLSYLRDSVMFYHSWLYSVHAATTAGCFLACVTSVVVLHGNRLVPDVARLSLLQQNLEWYHIEFVYPYQNKPYLMFTLFDYCCPKMAKWPCVRTHVV